MRRSRLWIAVAGVAALAAPAWGAGRQAPAGAGHYVLSAAPEGFVRLDTVSGAVSHCSQVAGVWRCDTIAGEDSGLRARLDALSLDVARLSTAVTALGSRVADLSKGTPAAVPAGPVAKAGPGVVTEVVHRFIAMIRTLKHREPAESAI